MSGHAHYREAHPLVFVMTHYINLICMIMLAFSGFYIHFPFFDGFMGVARGMHFFAMYLIVFNLTFRIIAAFFVKTATQLGSREKDTDIKNWLPQAENKHQFFETVKYYTFFRNTHVISGKYGALQKMAYLATIPITLFMAYTGFALYTPAHTWAIWPFFQGGINLLGSEMTMRVWHYFGMWVVILFTMVHAYLAAIDGFKPLWGLIFLWRETPGEEH